MNKRDILYEIYNNLLTDQQARELVDEAEEAHFEGESAISAREYANMSFDEYTALVLHGLHFSVIAKFRYEGWPAQCALCGKSFVFGENGTGWWAYRSEIIRGELVKNALVCLKCANVLAGISMREKARKFQKLRKKIVHKRKFANRRKR